MYFTEREVPAAAWVDAEDRHRAFARILIDARAPYASWRILDADNTPDAKRTDAFFAEFFVPMHAGKLDILDAKVLGDTALAKIKTRTTGEFAEDMECQVLLRREGGAWKVHEDC